MQFTQKDRKENTGLANLRNLHGKKKAQYFFDYYKLPLVIFCILLYLILYITYRHFTDKDPVLYATMINVNAGETLMEQLNGGFLKAAGIDASRNCLSLLSGLYLTDEEQNPYYEYTYASRTKLLAAIDGELLDVVFMDKEAFDAFSQNGYLCNIEDFLSEKDPDFYENISPFLVRNTFLEENETADASLSYHTVTYPMALDLSQADMIRQAGFQETVYLGILENSPRKDTALLYLKYLFTSV